MDSIPEEVRLEAFDLAEQFAKMETLIAESLNCDISEIPMTVVYESALEALKRRESASEIADTIAMMRKLIADVLQRESSEVPVGIAYQAALYVLKEYRRFCSFKRVEEEREALQPLLDAHKEIKELKQEVAKAKREKTRAEARQETAESLLAAYEAGGSPSTMNYLALEDKNSQCVVA